MRKLRFPLVATLATVGIAGAALAASGHTHTLDVTLPDGSIAHVRYAGKVAPTVQVTPADRLWSDTPGADAASPFAGMDAVVAMMARQHEAMMQQVAALQQEAQQAAQAGAMQTASAGKPGFTRTVLPGGMVLIASGQPANVSIRYVSTTTGANASANGCTQTVEYRSDGGNAQPQIIRTSVGTCDSASVPPSKALTATSASRPAAPQAAPGPVGAGKTV